MCSSDLLGNRIRTRREALAGGMPKTKYLANRGLTILENMLSGQNLGEWHSGFRAYSRKVLETVPWQKNSDGFVFDSQFLVQCVHLGFRLGDVPVPVRYFDEASSINFRRSVVYGLGVLGVTAQFRAAKLGLMAPSIFDPSGRRLPEAESPSVPVGAVTAATSTSRLAK